ncbi:hypothetical protein DUB99_22705 [Salmonella enterica subsp. enterica serovar Bonariensis]|nr:hypothetical protein [Salmonella enterica]EBW7040870.1 hypothetical protein [Salmonella enterica subsp. enterica serovar Bonariensis]EDT7939561.1 hypothetical protein [Salmonella enterica subsp. enterica serovar Aba]EBY0067604.1 hypothetical protein [Salmonella enterica subsp. enterica serovar Bonariensis]ECC5707798.1 hypothetical protein [Salmonella enterica]
MHSFCELIERSTSFTLYSLEQAESDVIEKLQTSSATVHIKQLQMLQLQRPIFAVGMFSIFEAHLQNGLSCQNGFKELRTILDAAGKHELKERFDNYYLAINALKHGDGASFRQLITKIHDLKFDVETPHTPVYEEGDVSAIRSLIKADDAFILGCAELIREISETISEQRPDYFA